jgi:hypothetical protein
MKKSRERTTEPGKGDRNVETRWTYCALPIVLLLGLNGCATVGPRPAHPAIVRLDGTRITPTILTERIEALTRTAQVQGLTVTIFNHAEKVYSQAFGFVNLKSNDARDGTFSDFSYSFRSDGN